MLLSLVVVSQHFLFLCCFIFLSSSTVTTVNSFLFLKFPSNNNKNTYHIHHDDNDYYYSFKLHFGSIDDDNKVTSTATTTNDDDGGGDDSDVEQRNLRFGGIGRLYSTTTNNDDEYTKVIDRMEKSTVIVVGLGGVGSWAAEALCRSGVGSLILIDLDDICISNTNRQLHAMTDTIGKFKIDELSTRFTNINPNCNITLIHDFVSPNNIDEILLSTITTTGVTACLDAIDGTRGKSSLIAGCARYGIPIVTCGGSAGRTDPTAFRCDDLSRVNGDPLLSSCRKTLRKLYGFEAGMSLSEIQKNKKNNKKNKQPKKWNIKAVYSTEPQKSLPQGSSDSQSSLRRCDGALGTGCFVTGTSGFVAAGEIVKMIAQDELVVPRNFKGNVPSSSSRE